MATVSQTNSQDVEEYRSLFSERSVVFGDTIFQESNCSGCKKKVQKTQMYAYHTLLANSNPPDVPEVNCIYHVSCLVKTLLEGDDCCRRLGCMDDLISDNVRFYISRTFFFQKFISKISFIDLLEKKDIFSKDSFCSTEMPDRSVFSDVSKFSSGIHVCCKCENSIEEPMHAYHPISAKDASENCIYHVSCVAEFLIENIGSSCFSEDCHTSLNCHTLQCYVSKTFFFENFFPTVTLGEILQVEEEF